MKICTFCKEEKETALFKKDAKKKDGFSSWCKKCHSIKNCEYQKKNRDKANVASSKYKKTEKGKQTRNKYKAGEAGLQAKKRYLSSEAGKSQQARSRATRRCNNDKVVNDLTSSEWSEILKEQNHKCNICGITFDNSNIKTRSERDHIIPLSKGGGLTRSNVQALCRCCNAKKYNN